MGVERITNMTPGTLELRAWVEVEDDDYEDVLLPELHRALEGGGGLRTLYLIEDIDEVEGEAMWADAKLGWNLGVKHRDAWVRSAIVTDIGWMARATKMFAWMMPGE